MSKSGRLNPRDLHPAERALSDGELSPKFRVFRLSNDDREQIAACLRQIDDARDAIERQQNPANRRVLRDLNEAADRIYDILNGLEDIGD